MSRVYLASSFSLADRVEAAYEALVEAGHEVPDIWWRDERLADAHPDAGTDAYYDLDEVQAMAERHYDHLREVDVFVLVCPEDHSRKFNGANVELGYAHAHDADLYALGCLERSAMYAPVERVDTPEDLVEALSPTWRLVQGPDSRKWHLARERDGDGYRFHDCECGNVDSWNVADDASLDMVREGIVLRREISKVCMRRAPESAHEAIPEREVYP